MRTRIGDKKVTIAMTMMVHPISPVTTTGDDDDDDDGFNPGDGAFDGDGDDGITTPEYSMPPDNPMPDTPPCCHSDNELYSPSIPLTPSPMPWTPSPMSQWGIYEQVAKTVALKPNQVRDVVEAMLRLAAKQLKKGKAFEYAGALNMKLKKSQSKKKVGKKMMTVRTTLSATMKKMIETAIPDAD